MPLSWTEIRDRATAFQKRWKDDTSEQAESQSFWTEFLNIFGVDRRRVALFEKQVSLKRAKSVKNGRRIPKARLPTCTIALQCRPI